LGSKSNPACRRARPRRNIRKFYVVPGCPRFPRPCAIPGARSPSFRTRPEKSPGPLWHQAPPHFPSTRRSSRTASKTSRGATGFFFFDHLPPRCMPAGHALRDLLLFSPSIEFVVDPPPPPVSTTYVPISEITITGLFRRNLPRTDRRPGDRNLSLPKAKTYPGYVTRIGQNLVSSGPMCERQIRRGLGGRDAVPLSKGPAAIFPTAERPPLPLHFETTVHFPGADLYLDEDNPTSCTIRLLSLDNSP